MPSSVIDPVGIVGTMARARSRPAPIRLRRSAHRDAREPGDVGHLHPAQAALLDGVARPAVGDLVERDAALDAGEGRAEARVDAVAETDREGLGPVDVEPAGVLIGALVTVRGA